jgi:SEC-C motif-containing protein
MKTKAVNLKTLHCPCSSDKQYTGCCGRYLDQGESAASAEHLMRSRYTAYTLNHENYLLATWHHSTHPTALGLANQPRNQWLGLTVKRHEQSAPDHAIVEFIARYRINGRADRLHEISRFVREGGSWFYVDGDLLQD